MVHIAVTLLLSACVFFDGNEAAELRLQTSASALQAMKSEFYRSERKHHQSMAAISRSMTSETALRVLRKHNRTNHALLQVAEKAMSSKASKLRAQEKDVNGIRDMLNNMIYEAMSKYDEEIQRCTSFYSTQCSLMEAARTKIAAKNSLAANARSLILDAQSCISRCETDIPNIKQTLKQHKLKCQHEGTKLKQKLTKLEGDIAAMTKILKEALPKVCPNSPPVTLLQKEERQVEICTDECTGGTFLRVVGGGAAQHHELRSEVGASLLSSAFADSPSFLQMSATVVPTNSPPVPQTQVPNDPCTDPNGGGPSRTHKRGAKCVLPDGDCDKMKERFLKIQSSIEDERDQLKDRISDEAKVCKEEADNLVKQITTDQDMLDNCQTKLAAATSKENDAAEGARQTSENRDQFSAELKKTMKECNTNYLNFEGEVCALKKIRGEVFKLKNAGSKPFFQDCQVSEWQADECSKECAGGTQNLVRSIEVAPKDGAKCLPLAAMKDCNTQPCPVDCEMEPWDGWSKCSAECGGGVEQRIREITRAAKYGGKACGSTSQTRTCNAQACEKDCDLSEWSEWSACSKDCDGGTNKRQKYVLSEPTGEGSCPDQWSLKRLQYKECNKHQCPLAAGSAVMSCKKKLDIVLLIDGSGSLGAKGWAAELVAAQSFVSAFENSGGDVQMSVILYSGPFYWSGVRNCFSGWKPGDTNHLENVCRVKIETSMSTDIGAVKNTIKALQWPKGSTLTSVALFTAAAEFDGGRADAQSVVVAITDGRPLSYRATWFAARHVRKKARLVFVAVTRYAPLRFLKRLATRRWEENLLYIKDFTSLQDEAAAHTNHIVASICPKSLG